jgi:hypothetical protein
VAGIRERGKNTEWVIGIGLFTGTALLLLSSVLFDIVRYQHGAFVAESVDQVAAGAARAAVFRWGAITDMLGGYLLLLPAVLYFRHRLRANREVTVDLISVAGAAFCIVGAAAAATYGFVGEVLIRDYARASAAAQPAIMRTFGLLDAVVVTALWQALDGILLATWLIGLGALVRRRWPWLGRYCIVLGVATAATALGRIVGQNYKGSVPETVVFLPLNLLYAWLGVLFVTGRMRSANSDAPPA